MDLIVSLAAVVATVNIPDVQPSFDAPFMATFWRIVSWILGGAIIVLIAALILAGVGLGFKGFGNSQYQQLAAKSIFYILGGVIIAVGAAGIVNFTAGLDFGL